MSRWRINPLGVEGVLRQVQIAQSRVGKRLASEELDPVGQAVTMPTQANPGAGRGNGVTGSVVSALDALFASHAASIRSIEGHILAGVYGVANATHEYDVAQQGMADATDPYAAAAAMQAQMFSAAQTGDLSYFDTHGYYRPMDAQQDGPPW